MQIERKSTADEARNRAPSGEDASNALLQRSEAYIRAHLQEPFSLDDLSRAMGTSPSTLLRTFNTHHGVSPMQYVKRLRLEAVRRSLSAANPHTTTVGYVASEFGFRQLGRFSAQYRKTFGELPSVTLRQNRHRLNDLERL